MRRSFLLRWVPVLLATGAAIACSSYNGSLAPPLINNQQDDANQPGTGKNTGSAPAVDAGTTPIVLPDGPPGIGFDDLRLAPALSEMLVPAGRTGNLDLVDPSTERVTSVGGFSTEATYSGNGFGVTSADEGAGLLFATDRTADVLAVVDPQVKAIIATTALDQAPGYVRYARATSEAWITEPSAKQIEVLAVSPSALEADAESGAPTHSASIALTNGPESLEIDPVSNLAFTNGTDKTYAIDVTTRAIKGTWTNGCTTAKGLAVDSTHKWVIAACAEGRVTVLSEQGEMIGSLTTASGVDRIAYDAQRMRVYVPTTSTSSLSVVQLDPQTGAPSLLGRVDTTPDASCVGTSGGGALFVCVPSRGELLFLADPF